MFWEKNLKWLILPVFLNWFQLLGERLHSYTPHIRRCQTSWNPSRVDGSKHFPAKEYECCQPGEGNPSSEMQSSWDFSRNDWQSPPVLSGDLSPLTSLKDSHCLSSPDTLLWTASTKRRTQPCSSQSAKTGLWHLTLYQLCTWRLLTCKVQAILKKEMPVPFPKGRCIYSNVPRQQVGEFWSG